jgi:hypothetical protein
VKRLVAPLVAAVLLVLAAAGLSLRPSTTTASLASRPYPRGRLCRPSSCGRPVPSAWATLIVLGLAGLLSLYFGFHALVGALIWGSCAALVATRSLTATATAIGVLIAGTILDLWNGTPIGWAVLLLPFALGDRILDAADNRLARDLAGF